MTLIDEREEMYEQEKRQKTTKLIMKIIAILVILLIILIICIKTKDSKSVKIILDGKEQSNIDNGLILKNEEGKIYEENGEIYISVQKLATLLNYQYYNSEYKQKGEDKTKCQVRIKNEYTSYISQSNQIYKSIVYEKEENKNNTINNNPTVINVETEEDKLNVDYEYFTTNNNVKYINDEIYASKEAIEIGFDVSITYDFKKNAVSIYTSDYLEMFSKSKRSDIVSSSEYEYINKRLLKYGMSIVKDSAGNLGVGSYTNQEKINSYVASCKYSDIRFNEAQKNLEVITSEDNKKCILNLDLNSQEVTNVIASQYTDIKSMDNEFKYFLIKENDKYGVMNSEGKIIMYPLFEQIGIEEKSYINIVNKYILNDKYIPVKQNGLWGLYNIEGQKLIEPQFQNVGCPLSQSGESVVIISNIKENIDGIVFLYNKESSLYGVYNTNDGNKIAISLSEVFRKVEDGNESYYINYVIDRENSVVHTINIHKDL